MNENDQTQLNDYSSAGVTIRQNAGMTRVTLGSTADQQPDPMHTPWQAARVSQGGTRFVQNGDGSYEAVQSGVTRYQAGQDAPTHSVAATRQRINGSDTVELQPGNPASRTTIKTAIADGLIKPVGNGEYADVAPVAPRGAEASREVAGNSPETVPECVSQQEEALWAEDIASLSQHSYDGALAGIASAITRGASFDDVAKSFAATEGLEPELAAEYVQEGYGLHERILARDLSATSGITGAQKDKFYGWLRENRARHLPEAVMELAQQRKTDAFRRLATEFKRTNPADGSAFEKAGFQTRIDGHTGDLLVRRGQGAWMAASKF